MNQTAPTFARYCRLVLALTTFSILVRLPSRFWCDETMSYWIAAGGIREILARCSLFPQSVAYCSLVLALRSLGAHSEWIFRLPSFLAVAGATVLLFRLCRRLFEAETAWMTIAVFLLMPAVRFAAGDARPYAFALLLAVLASDLFVRFVSRPGYRLAALYGLTAAGILYFQVLFGAVLIAHGLYLVYVIWRGDRISPRYIAMGIATAALAAVPVMVQYAHLSGSTASHSFGLRPVLQELADSFLPGNDAFIFELLAVVVLVTAGAAWESTGVSGWPVFAVLCALLPPVIVFAVSRVSPAKIFIPRYYLDSAPGLAICLALILTAFRMPAARRAIVAALVLLAVHSIGLPSSFRHAREYGDWGGAVAYVNGYLDHDRVPVLVRSQFPESDYFPLTPIESTGLFAPFTYYPIDTRIFPLPVTFNERQAALIHSLLRSPELASRRILLLSFAGPTSDAPYIFYIQGQLGPECRVREIANFGGVAVTEFAW